MKKILLFSVIAFSLALGAQEVPEPEFANRPYALMAGAYKSLEKSESQMGVHEIKGGNELYYVAANEKSTVRLGNANPSRFIMKVAPGTDPSDVIKLLKGESKRGKRYFVFEKRSNSSKAGDMSNVLMQIEFKKLREGVYEILMPPTLTPGEYAFTQKANVTLFCFGVD